MYVTYHNINVLIMKSLEPLLKNFMASHGGRFVLDTHTKTLNRLAEERKRKCNIQHL